MAFFACKRVRLAMLLLGVIPVFLGTGPVRALADTATYISAQGQALHKGVVPWVATGYNDVGSMSVTTNAYNCGGQSSGADTDAEVKTDFASIKAAGGDAVRVWFLQAYAINSTAYWNLLNNHVALTSSDVNYWVPFDRVLSIAQQDGLKVIPAFIDQWDNCGDVDWGPQTFLNLSWYQGGYQTSTLDGLPLTYYQWVNDLVSRYSVPEQSSWDNSTLIDPTTIAFWQLANEAEADNSWDYATGTSGGCTEASAASALNGFAATMTSAIKSVDANHLVNLGTIGGGQCGLAGGDYQFVNSPTDLCEDHDYTNAPHAIYSNPCATLNKPYFIGERGQPCPANSCSSDAAEAGAYLQDAGAAFIGGASGYLAWTAIGDASSGLIAGPALNYWFPLRRDAANAEASAVGITTALTTETVSPVAAAESWPVSFGSETHESATGIHCDPYSASCPGGVGGLTLRAPSQSALATLRAQPTPGFASSQFPTPTPCDSELDGLPLQLSAMGSACSDVGEVSAVAPVGFTASGVSDEAVAENCGTGVNGTVAIGELNVGGIQIVGGPSALVQTPGIPPNTVEQLNINLPGQPQTPVDVTLNGQLASNSGIQVYAFRVSVPSDGITITVGNAQAYAPCS